MRKRTTGHLGFVVFVLSLTVFLQQGAAAGSIQPDNLAKSAFNIVPSMSSQKVDNTQEVEAALDGNFTTKWTSEAGSFPNWVEIMWPQPVTLNKLVVDEDPSGRTSSYRVDVWTDGAWQTIVGATANNTPSGGTLTINFTPVETTRVRYYMLSGYSTISSIAEIQAGGSAAWITAMQSMTTNPWLANNTYTVETFRMSPSQPVPGQKFRLELDLRPNATYTKDYGFKVFIGESVVGNPQWGANYSVVTTYARPPVPTSTWVAGQVYTVPIDVFLPNWAPHGDMPVKVEMIETYAKAKLAGYTDGIIGNVHIKRFEAEPVQWTTETPQSEVRLENGQPKLYVNNKMTPPYIMADFATPSYWEMGAHAMSGIHMWRTIAFKWVNYSYETAAGQAENTNWFAALDQQINALLRCDPNAHVIVCSMVRPSNTWTSAYPDDATLLSNGVRTGHSLSSRRWMGQIQYDYTALVNHLMSSSYAGHVIGISFETSNETQYWGSDDGYNTSTTLRDDVVIGDYSPEHIRAFRDWLKVRYNNDLAALRAAWKDSAVTFDTAYPDIAVFRRQDVANSSFKDPNLTRMPLDYWEFHSEQMANMAIYTGQVIKLVSGNKYLTGLWGFYSNGFRAATRDPGIQHYGYCGLQKVVESPYIDIIVPLRSYAMTRWGTPSVPINLSETIRRHGKIELVEYDERTFYCGYRDMPQHSQQETMALLRRNFSASAIRSDGLWWVGFGGTDFGSGSAGRISYPWYGEESITNKLAEGKGVYDTIYKSGGSKSISQVAVFMNNADVYAMDIMFTRRILASAQYQTAYFELPKLGAPVDCYQLDDVYSVADMDQYKVYVFLNAFYLTPTQRAQIKSVVNKPGKTVVWLYAPGYSNGSQLSTANIQDLTGITVGTDFQTVSTPTATVQSGHSLTNNIQNGYAIRAHPYEGDPTPYSFGPMFYVNDASAEPLAYYTYNSSRVAYATKVLPSGMRSIFLGVPYMDSVVLRQICRVAGVHLYCDSDALIDATEKYIMITGGTSGFSRIVPLPSSSYVYDIQNKTVVGSAITSFLANVPAYQSAVYYVAPNRTGNPFAVLPLLTGHVELQDFVAGSCPVAVKVELIQGGSTVRTETVVIGADGNYSIPNVTPGAYSVAFKASQFLRKIETGITVQQFGTATCNTSLLNGDLNGDNRVSSTPDVTPILSNMDILGQ